MRERLVLKIIERLKQAKEFPETADANIDYVIEILKFQEDKSKLKGEYIAKCKKLLKKVQKPKQNDKK